MGSHGVWTGCRSRRRAEEGLTCGLTHRHNFSGSARHRSPSRPTSCPDGSMCWYAAAPRIIVDRARLAGAAVAERRRGAVSGPVPHRAKGARRDQPLVTQMSQVLTQRAYRAPRVLTSRVLLHS